MSDTTRHRWSRAALCAATLLLAACGGDAGEGPPEVRAGRDECVECGMIISDVKFAAASEVVVDLQLEVRRFDDIGDMLAHERANPELVVKRRWVADLDRRGLIPAETAWYVRSASVVTPMASGIVAYSDESRALQAAAQVGCVPLRWEELRKAVAAAGAGLPPAPTAIP